VVPTVPAIFGALGDDGVEALLVPRLGSATNGPERANPVIGLSSPEVAAAATPPAVAAIALSMFRRSSRAITF
jgi:hypothetical protein